MMYVLQDKPDTSAVLGNGSTVDPIATLKDEFGGVSHIIRDDHCYVLINGAEDRPFEMVSHWYAEAAAALKSFGPASVDEVLK